MINQMKSQNIHPTLRRQAVKVLPIIQAMIDDSPRLKNKYSLMVSNIDFSQSLSYFLDAWYIEPLKFPKLPEGEEWNNPDNLTPEQVEVDKGWRLLTVSEVLQNQKIINNEPFPDTDYQLYRRDNVGFWDFFTGYTGTFLNNTYRTRKPLPKPQTHVEMTVAEIEAALGKKIKIVK
jgi:hypothetical protein